MGRQARLRKERSVGKKVANDKVRELAGERGIAARDGIAAGHAALASGFAQLCQRVQAAHLSWLADSPTVGYALVGVADQIREFEGLLAQWKVYWAEYDAVVREKIDGGS